ncbi:hypothetical protein PV682_17150 [Streptomyces niveiscabiei]|uniref:hypothetical protein n=1 Tax=Streptomyces niveiscabiei TaxID=164115 RepID=UPI0029BA1217|nr:hypothetical protein [Streptomyces niveiscabiei]MDX3383184.1 hypothetical protein [Streptomyces niveiscabiei]
MALDSFGEGEAVLVGRAVRAARPSPAPGSPDFLPVWKALRRRQCDTARQILARAAAEASSPCPAA